MKRIILPAFALLGLYGCYNDSYEELYPAPACDTSNITYSGVVSPILITNCASAGGCHKSQDSLSSFSVALDNIVSVQKVAWNGQLMGAITHTSPYHPMPKNQSKLDDCTISKIQIWVDRGAPNN